ncbi:HNH endonuclease [Geomonas silvestris]|uniref:HNH endonuclease n=1 Tax=Geomonas silvestris TaxID=2740184 RepID=A0A6V8MJU5_9BACT|nr:HNH endonuclease [Geomonas silvestris]GFO60232.1 HNH endonuclease [Geomonas silvestris]
MQNYCADFTKLNRAPGPMWGEETKRRAPHKPILLLAVLDLVHRGVITSPFISISGDLVELNELFNLYWQCVVPLGQTSSIAFPFSRLNNEPFWELVPIPGKSITQAVINNTSSVSYLRKYALGAKLDDNLFAIMATDTGREGLREALLQSCFSPVAQILLREQSSINREAFDYGTLLEKQAHQQVAVELPPDDYRPVARSQGFRRSIIRAYDHRCALCGVRIITPDQQTAVDAAHIVPWSQSKNDDIRNGMALCKLCHWAFDRGMIGVANDYSVITSRHIAANANVPGLLTTLAGRGIIPPADKDLWPAQHYLVEHRKAWRL